jgi:hypothetical protein
MSYANVSVFITIVLKLLLRHLGGGGAITKQ